MILRLARRGTLVFALFVLFVVALLLHRSRLLLLLLFKDDSADAIYPADVSPQDVNITSPQLISKIIHQTYKDESSIPAHWQAGQQAVKDLHPDWEYMFWTDASALSFIQTNYPAHLSTYTSYRYPIQRVDAFRYFVLYHYGGIYLDLDIAPYRSLEPLLKYPAIACRTIPTGISNDMLGSVAGHKFWKHVTDNLATYNKNWLISYITIMYSTGPLFLSVMWVDYLSALGSKPSDKREEIDRIRVLVRQEELGDSYGFINNVQGGSWHAQDVEMIFWMGRHWVVVTILGFVIGFAIAGVLWSILKRLARLGGQKQAAVMLQYE